MLYPIRFVAKNNLVSSVEHLDDNLPIQGEQVSFALTGVDGY